MRCAMFMSVTTLAGTICPCLAHRQERDCNLVVNHLRRAGQFHRLCIRRRPSVPMAISQCRSQFMHITRVGEKGSKRADVYHSFLVLLIYYRFHVLWPGLYRVRFRHTSIPCFASNCLSTDGAAMTWLFRTSKAWRVVAGGTLI